LVCRFYRTISHRSYDQLGALKPLFGVARPLWWSKEVHVRQHLHDLPPDGRLVAPDRDQILPLIAAISWRPVQHDATQVRLDSPAPYLKAAVSSAYLSKKLTRPLATKDGGTLRTILDVRAYMLRLSKDRERSAQWQRAAQLLLAHADVAALFDTTFATKSAKIGHDRPGVPALLGGQSFVRAMRNPEPAHG
jgi:hypothetical protein